MPWDAAILARFARPEGSWQCNVCLTWNKNKYAKKCISCESPRLNYDQIDKDEDKTGGWDPAMLAKVNAKKDAAGASKGSSGVLKFGYESGSGASTSGSSSGYSFGTGGAAAPAPAPAATSGFSFGSSSGGITFGTGSSSAPAPAPAPAAGGFTFGTGSSDAPAPAPAPAAASSGASSFTFGTATVSSKPSGSLGGLTFGTGATTEEATKPSSPRKSGPKGEFTFASDGADDEASKAKDVMGGFFFGSNAGFGAAVGRPKAQGPVRPDGPTVRYVLPSARFAALRSSSGGGKNNQTAKRRRSEEGSVVDAGNGAASTPPPTGFVYSWGSGDCDQLGHGKRLHDDDDSEQPVPKLVAQMPNGKLAVHISCGGLHSAALTASGEVYTWGCNDDEALGRGPAIADNEARLMAFYRVHAKDKATRGHAQAVLAKYAADLDALFLKLQKKYGEHPGGESVPGRVFVRGFPLPPPSSRGGRVGTPAKGGKATRTTPRRTPRRSSTKRKRGHTPSAGAGAGAGGASTPAAAARVVDLPIAQVECGDCHSVALSADGRVFTWGTYKDSNGYIGFKAASAATISAGEDYKGTDKKMAEPFMVDVKHGLMSGDSRRIVQVSAGSHHTCALTESGRLLTWGDGEHGQLGRRVLPRHKKDGLQVFPVQMSAKLKRKACVTAVFCCGYRTFALVRPEGDGEGSDVYAWGLNNYGQLGLGDRVTRDQATKVKALSVETLGVDASVVQLDGGIHHSLALTANGAVLAFGRGDSGQLGVTKDVVVRQGNADPVEVTAGGLKDVRVAAIACGSNHNAVVTVGGELYSWGFGEMAQLGHPELEDQELPRRVAYFDGAAAGGAGAAMDVDGKSAKVIAISAGGQHTLAVADASM